MNPGDLFWVEFPPRPDHTQSGRRPAIVFQSQDASSKLPTVLLIPLTTQIDALRFPGTTLIEPDAINGLRRPSVALAFQTTAVDKRFIKDRLGSLASNGLDAVWDAFRGIAGPTEAQEE